MKYQIFLKAVPLLLCLTEVMPINTPDCPEIYQRFSTSHSFCQPKNKNCNILQSNLVQENINEVVHLHNHYRSIIATQQKEGRGLPHAADMIFMEWDNELAAIAQRHADQCVYAHDEGDQRRVQNFGVGQNIAKISVGGGSPPKPNWKAAIDLFYGEIKNFKSSMVCGSRKLTPGQGVIGHFTQLIWSRTFRIGCGFTMYKEGNTFIQLYVCNYGPGGNYGGSCVYKEGPACSKCPRNTQCTVGGQYPGLCKRTNGDAPYQPITAPHFFECDLRNPSSPDCKIYAVGVNKWRYIPSLSGKYLEIVLQPGENGTIVFTKNLIPSTNAKSMCIQIRYRKGPTLAKDAQNNVGKALFIIPSYNDWTAAFDFPSYDNGFRYQLTAYSLTLQWNSRTEMKITFAVPKGASPQFFNVASFIGFENECGKVEY